MQRAGEILVQAVDRAADLVRRTLDYAREGPPPLDLAPVALAPLVGEAAETARPPGSAVRMDNDVDPAILVRADRIQLFRVLTNLLRNAAEAGARSVRISAQHDNTTLAVEIADDGPGLPEAVRSRSVPPVFRQHAAGRRRARPCDCPRSDGGAWRRHRAGLDRRVRHHVPPHPAACRTGAVVEAASSGEHIAPAGSADV